MKNIPILLRGSLTFSPGADLPFNGASINEVEYNLMMLLVTECDGNDDELWF